MITVGLPHKRVLPGTVGGDTLDSNFTREWLIDARPYFPVKKTGASLTLSVTPDAARTVSLLGLINHTVSATNTVTVGSLGTITVPAWGVVGIAFNAATLIAPTSTGAGPFNVTVSGNGEPAVIIGDLWLGESIELPDFLSMRDLDPGETFGWESGLQPNYDGFSDIRRYSGQIVLTDEEYEDLQLWYRGSRKGTMPSLVVLDQTDEVLLCQMNYTEKHGELHHFIQLELVELPRPEW